jgi:hypothetical protein
MMKLYYLAVLVFCFCQSLFAAGSAPDTSLHAVRTNLPITIDGKLSEPIWQRPGFEGFHQRDPKEGAEPTERTVVWIAYDDGAIYIAARMFDRAPDSLTKRLSRRDASWNSDMFFFDVDSYHDHQTGYYFALDAAGTFYDGTLLNDDWNDDTWDGVWEGKVRIDSLGWTAEMRIPYSQLRFRNADSLTWGINFRRDIARRSETDWVVFTPKGGSGFVSRFPDLTGLQGIHASSRIEALPYMTTRAEYLQHAPGDPFNSGAKYRPGVGVDLKMGLGSSLTLDGTINPDFGQVEVDPAVVNLSDVETYFNEKRPFFVEGQSIFTQYGRGGVTNYWGFNWGNPNIFYSRRIGRAPQGSVPETDFVELPNGTSIIGAAKLTGKVGDSWNVGAINAVTAREDADLQTAGQGTKSEVEPPAYYGVFRAQKEFNDSHQAIGAIATVTARQLSGSRLQDELNKSAVVAGLDGWSFLDSSKTWVLNGWATVSNVHGTQADLTRIQMSSAHYLQRPDARAFSLDSSATSLTGYSGRLYLNKQQGNIIFNSSLGIISPKFDNTDLGFLWRTDMINSHVGFGYQWTDPGSWYQRMQLIGAAFRTYDFDGDITWQGVFGLWDITFLNFYELQIDAAYNPQTFNSRRTRGGPVTLNASGYQYDFMLQTDPRKDWVFQVQTFTYKDLFTSWSISADLEWRPLPNLSLSVGPGFEHNGDYAQYVTTVPDPFATTTYGNRYVMANLQQSTVSANIRVNWTFTPKLSLQLFMQPLISAANFTDFKEVARPRSLDYLVYGTQGSTITRAGQSFVADPDGNGPAPAFGFDDPTFNLRSFRGNAVLRWEYLPGSTLYFVWTQSRADQEEIGNLQFRHSFRKLLDAHPDNIFMVKMTFWYGK